MDPLNWTGLLVGIAFGFALSRGRFCMNSAFRDILLLKDFTLAKAVALALLVEMLGFGLMAVLGIITLAPKPLLLWANIIGGFVFGIGMVLAGGCASGITYRVGEGLMGALSAVVGLTVAALLTSMGFLKPVAAALQATKIMTADDKSLTLANILGLPLAWTMVILAIVLLVVWFFIARKNPEDDFSPKKATLNDKIFKHGWSWLWAGIAIGIVGIIAFPASAATGRNYPLGITGGWNAIGKTIVTGQSAIAWEALLIIGIVIGAALAAVIAKEFKIRSPKPLVLVQTFFGGALMGFGAMTSTGCNVGHILSGVPQLSIGSIVGGLFIILGGWAAAWFLFIRPSNA